MKGIQNKIFLSRKVISIHVSGLCHRKGKPCKFSFSHARLTRMRRHISATMLGSLGQSDGWKLRDRSAEVDQSLGLIGRQI
jgi:hypothetical protein